MTGDRPPKIRIGCVSCSPHTISDLMGDLRRMIVDRDDRPRTITCVNAHIYNCATRDAELRRLLDESRVVAADGVSIVWAARLWGASIAERCNMTEAFRAFLHAPQMPPTRGVLMGGSRSEAEEAARRIEQQSTHCRIIRAVSGYLDDGEYREILTSCGNPDFIFVGMGTPKSERMVSLASRMVPQAIVWHIGGGTIRFYAGTMSEAPRFLRRAGLQWLHRLALEPRRMGWRYLAGNPMFILRIVGTRLAKGMSPRH